MGGVSAPAVWAVGLALRPVSLVGGGGFWGGGGGGFQKFVSTCEKKVGGPLLDLVKSLSIVSLSTNLFNKML